MTGMSLIVKTVCRWLKGFILLFGVYIVLYGHLTPGGGFSGGVIIACAFILIFLAEGKLVETKIFSKNVAGELDSVGILIFWAAALTGLFCGGVYFKNFITTAAESHFKLFSSGIIPICNIGIGLKVGASLFVVFVILAAVKIVVPKKSDNINDHEEDEK
ncbi:MnhB domain-containing protein [bacterium]|nr:MnhB domain-containing protein [bacterium]